MSGIKELITDDGIRIMPKPDFVTYEQIQDCLNKAHQVNEQKGLVYATAHQSVDTLKEKLKDAVTYVALNTDNQVVATASVQFRQISHWYHTGDIALLKLVGVLPEYSGRNLALLLLLLRGFEAKRRKVEVMVTDSAEENIAIRNLYLGCGFKVVDCCKYAANSFISIVYAYWFHGCPYSDERLLSEYQCHREILVSQS